MHEKITIGDALVNAIVYLEGELFSDEEIAIVDAAFAKLGAKRPSDDKGECARALLALMRS